MITGSVASNSFDLRQVTQVIILSSGVTTFEFNRLFPIFDLAHVPRCCFQL